ncbi:hypothetical protein HanPI659440_Chr17g0662021 [Helianthus annuus]|nr:hypothetical protein HanPI659440_Chr17g0662021 [Helianthus annuus]
MNGVVFFLVFIEITSVFNMVAIMIGVVALTVALAVITRDGDGMNDGVHFNGGVTRVKDSVLCVGLGCKVTILAAGSGWCSGVDCMLAMVEVEMIAAIFGGGEAGDGVAAKAGGEASGGNRVRFLRKSMISTIIDSIRTNDSFHC